MSGSSERVAFRQHVRAYQAAELRQFLCRAIGEAAETADGAFDLRLAEQELKTQSRHGRRWNSDGKYDHQG
jgi:hypothetical protein